MARTGNAAAKAAVVVPGTKPKCPSEHVLEEKTVAGSYFKSCKKCSGCEAVLQTGGTRHSCKSCGYHLCPSCHHAVQEALLWTEVTITLYRAAQANGQAEDTFQVSIERSATVGALKQRIMELYGIPPPLQQLKRDADDREPLADAEQLSVDEGDVLYFSTGNPFDPLAMMGPALGPLSGLADAFAGAMAGVAEEGRIMMENLERTTYKLTFVMPSNQGCPERRCNIEVSAMAFVSEVLDMVKLELSVESQDLALEFAGERLPPGAPIHSLGLRGGDTVMVALNSTTSGV